MGMALYEGARLDHWETPRSLRAFLVQTFGINWDMCASERNTLAPNFHTEESSCMRVDWPTGPRDVCFMNPPFSKAEKFINFAVWQAKRRGVRVVILYKANMETKWWQDSILEHAKFIWIPRGRVQYELHGQRGKKSCSFTSVVAVFNIPMTELMYLALKAKGQIVMPYPEIIDFDCLA